MKARLWRPLALGATCFAGLTAMGPGNGPAAPADMKIFAGLEKGQWELRPRGMDRGAAIRKLCLGDPAQLFQMRGGDAGCERFVVTDTPERASITYQCRGNGAGRTDLRMETPRLVQISAQGVVDGAPFSETLEARRTGPCR